MSLADLEKELYGQKSRRSRQTLQKNERISEKKAPPENPWEAPSSGANTETSVALGIFAKWGKVATIGLVGILVVALGFAGFYLYQFFTTRDVALSIQIPTEVPVGVPFLASLAFENTSQRSLASPTISLVLPEGIVYVADNTKRIVSFDLDPIAPGQTVKKDFEIAIVGKALETYRIDGRVSYTYEASTVSSRFEKRVTAAVLGRDPAISLDLNTPQSVLNGQGFEVHLSYQNATDKSLSNARISFTVPEEFTLNNSDPALDNMGLEINSLVADAENIVIFSGEVFGEENSFFEIEARGEIKIGDAYYPINTKTASIKISPSPLGLSFSFDREREYLLPGERPTYNITFSNNSDINLSDVVIKAQLAGDMIDFSSIESNGYFDDASRTVTWTAANIPELKELKAKESGKTSLRFSLRSYYPIQALSDKNFVVRVEGTISSPTVPYNVVAQQTTGVAAIEHKVAGRLDIAQRIYFQNPSFDIVNQGSLPPRVGVPVQYTVYWQLASWGTDFRDVSLQAFLGPGVRWTGKVKTNTSVAPQYNERTQEVLWNVGSLQGGAGVVTASPELIFQIEYTPPSTQVGNRFPLLIKTTIQAIDDFTGKTTTTIFNEAESNDLADTFLPGGYDKVQQ